MWLLRTRKRASGDVVVRVIAASVSASILSMDAGFLRMRFTEIIV
jgi:hypothetical protein